MVDCKILKETDFYTAGSLFCSGRLCRIGCRFEIAACDVIMSQHLLFKMEEHMLCYIYDIDLSAKFLFKWVVEGRLYI